MLVVRVNGTNGFDFQSRLPSDSDLRNSHCRQKYYPDILVHNSRNRIDVTPIIKWWSRNVSARTKIDLLVAALFVDRP